MSYARSSGEVRVGDPSSGLGSSSLTCSSSTYSLKGELGKWSRISGGWTEKSTGESRAITRRSGATTEGICASSRKLSKTKEEEGRHESEKAQQKSDVPKRQHCGRYKDDERKNHNTGTPFEFRHN